tara:strand:+ start:341 stop:556 length:216 start_codon:yes stop_codon:yes gene_type:complete
MLWSSVEVEVVVPTSQVVVALVVLDLLLMLQSLSDHIQLPSVLVELVIQTMVELDQMVEAQHLLSLHTDQS